MAPSTATDLYPAKFHSGRSGDKLSYSTWLLPISGAMAYPLLVKALFAGAAWSRAHDGVASSFGVICAIAAAAFAFLVPAIALRSLIALRKSKAASAPRMRMILHFAFATPPLFILMGIPAAIFALSLAGDPGANPEQQIGLLLWWRDLFWWGFWTIVALILALVKRDASPASTQNSPTPGTRSRLTMLTPRLRKIHRYAALVVVLAFLALHLSNHLAALWSMEAQQSLMKILRLWYRAPGIEPAILAIFAVSGVLGMFLVVRWTRSPGDVFRAVQTSSGFYLALFLINHLLAVFRNRSTGVNTDWLFATGGKPGMLGSEAYVAVFLYYSLAILLVSVHLGTGLRMAFLAQGMSHKQADKIVAISSAGGAVLAGLIMAALLGVRLSHLLNP